MELTAVLFTDLPPELLVSILSYLPVQALATCNYVNQTLRAVISNSILLQYKIALHKACALDNENCTLSYSEKLRLLKQKEESWSSCTPNFHRVVPLSFSPGSVYDLSGDVYLLGDHTRQRLQYLRLPHSNEEIPQWRTFHSDENRNAAIVDFGVNLQEHDLIALVTA